MGLLGMDLVVMCMGDLGVFLTPDVSRSFGVIRYTCDDSQKIPFQDSINFNVVL